MRRPSAQDGKRTDEGMNEEQVIEFKLVPPVWSHGDLNPNAIVA